MHSAVFLRPPSHISGSFVCGSGRCVQINVLRFYALHKEEYLAHFHMALEHLGVVLNEATVERVFSNSVAARCTTNEPANQPWCSDDL